MRHHALKLAGQETAIANFVPYAHLVTESIIETRQGDYLFTLQLQGRAFEAHAASTHRAWIEQLNSVLAVFRQEPLAYWTHLIRRWADAPAADTFSPPWCAQYDERYRRQWQSTPALINELYLTVVLRPYADPLLAKLSRFERRRPEELRVWQDKAIATLAHCQSVLCSALTAYGPRLLQTYTRGDVVFSETADFLGTLINGQHAPQPLSAGHLYDNLPVSRVFFGRWGQFGELRQPGWRQGFGALEIFQFGSHTRPAHMDALLQLPFPLTLAQSFTPLMKPQARQSLRRQGRLMTDTDDDATSQIEQLFDARDALASDRIIAGEYDSVMLIWGQDSHEIQARQAAAISQLAEGDMIAKAIDIALAPAWWSALPANWRWRLRPRVMSSLNFLSLSPLHNYPTGKAQHNPWGAAVTPLKTPSGGTYYLNLHGSAQQEDATHKRYVGNTSIIGESGSGKTVLLAHLLAQSHRFEATMAVFDKDCGLQVAIMLMGGQYFALRLGEPTGWNPLQLPETPQNQSFLHQWIILLCEQVDGPLTGSEKEQLALALSRMQASLPPAERRLSVLVQLLPNPRVDAARLNLHQRLAQWCAHGPYGWLFDHAQDSLQLDAQRLLGFDLGQLLAHPVVGTAAMFFLTHRTDALLDGRRFMYVFDECQHPLRYPWFQAFLQDKAQTIRKRNGVLVLATQEPDTLLCNPVGKSLIQQSATQIFLPNTKATPTDYIDGLRLTEAEFALIRGLGKFSRQMLIKQDDDVVRATLDLSALNDVIAAFSGSADKAAMAQAVIAEYGTDPAHWLPVFLSRLTHV